MHFFPLLCSPSARLRDCTAVGIDSSPNQRYFDMYHTIAPCARWPMLTYIHNGGTLIVQVVYQSHIAFRAQQHSAGLRIRTVALTILRTASLLGMIRQYLVFARMYEYQHIRCIIDASFITQSPAALKYGRCVSRWSPGYMMTVQKRLRSC